RKVVRQRDGHHCAPVVLPPVEELPEEPLYPPPRARGLKKNMGKWSGKYSRRQNSARSPISYRKGGGSRTLGGSKSSFHLMLKRLFKVQQNVINSMMKVKVKVKKR